MRGCAVAAGACELTLYFARREAVRAELNGALKELFDGATAQEPPGVKPLGPLQELYVEVSRRGRRLSVGPLAPGPELEYPALHHRLFHRLQKRVGLRRVQILLLRTQSFIEKV